MLDGIQDIAEVQWGTNPAYAYVCSTVSKALLGIQHRVGLTHFLLSQIGKNEQNGMPKQMMIDTTMLRGTHLDRCSP